MSRIFDFHSDPDMAVLKDILRSEGPSAIPDYVTKAANLVPSEEFRMEKKAFAWPQRMMYALDTPADVWFSRQYFEKCGHLIPIQYRGYVNDNIRRSEEMFGIDTSLPSQKMAKVASVDERTAEEQVYGIQKTASGTRYEIESREQAKIAMASFPEGIPVEELHKAASALKEAAERFDVHVSLLAERWAEPVKRSFIVDQMSARLAHCENHNRRAQVVNAVQEKAASYQYTSKLTEYPTYDPQVVEGYRLLMTKAATIDAEDLPSFINLCASLDEVADMNKVAGMANPAWFNRAFEDDLAPKFVKVAGYRVPIAQLRGMAALDSLIPETAGYGNQPIKFAFAIENAPMERQQAVLRQVRW